MKTPLNPIPVHALGDERTHLALPYRGRLRQGRLKTLCGLHAVTELPLFVMAETRDRCRKCFGMIDEFGALLDRAAEPEPAAARGEADARAGAGGPARRPPATPRGRRRRSGRDGSARG
jgi:hypothetical protein